MNRIRITVARKLAPYWQEMRKLNNPYLASIKNQDFDYKDSDRMRAFLMRVNSINHFTNEK